LGSGSEVRVAVIAAANAVATAMAMKVAPAMATAVTTAVAAEMSIASDSYVEGMSVLDAAAGRYPRRRRR
jgi:hypothetical protein